MDLRAGPQVVRILSGQCGALELIDPLLIDDLKNWLEYNPAGDSDISNFIKNNEIFQKDKGAGDEIYMARCWSNYFF